jgi:catechol 2,3-dioxygenase-like lactoylglutathione lyase family enzyme
MLNQCLLALYTLSSRAKRGICFFLFSSLSLWICSACFAQERQQRPHIFGIASVHIGVSDVAASTKFYTDVTGIGLECNDCGQPAISAPYILPSKQLLEVNQGDSTVHASRVTRISFLVDNLKSLERILKANDVHYSATNVNGRYLMMLNLEDPEGNKLEFWPVSVSITTKMIQKRNPPESPYPMRIIHAGWVVKNRAAMEKFYKDILGFHIYWSGGMKDGETDWVDMQVPDGTDWIEFMLNVPADADKHTLGVMNHIALGVPDIHAAQQQLMKNGWKGTEQPQIGRDGKWQLNLYDPDQTRVELMEFIPVEKPCCSEYTGPHPKP